MGELNVMKKALRQQDETVVSQSKVADGYYKFYTKPEGVDAEVKIRYVININEFPAASEYQKDIYKRKGSDEVDKENNHYAILEMKDQVIFERENKDIRDLIYFNEFNLTMTREEYEDLIMKGE